MTLKEIEESDKIFLLAKDVEEILCTNANHVRWQAHHKPEALGFPVTVIKTRVKIPRLPFLKYIKAL